MAIDNGGLINKYHCYDCGAIHTIEGIEIYKKGEVTKYVCKDCGGRCIPESEIGKSKGIKSKKQRFSNSSFINYIIISVVILGILFFGYSFYKEQEVKRDFKSYVTENESLRKDIEPFLVHYRDDIQLIKRSLKEKISKQKIQQAENRLNKSKKIIMSNAWRTESIKKPSTEEVFELYQTEINFFSNPSYKNYILYIGMFNKMESKFKKDIVSSITKTIKATNSKKKSNTKTKKAKK